MKKIHLLGAALALAGSVLAFALNPQNVAASSALPDTTPDYGGASCDVSMIDLGRKVNLGSVAIECGSCVVSSQVYDPETDSYVWKSKRVFPTYASTTCSAFDAPPLAPNCTTAIVNHIICPDPPVDLNTDTDTETDTNL